MIRRVMPAGFATGRRRSRREPTLALIMSRFGRACGPAPMTKTDMIEVPPVTAHSDPSGEARLELAAIPLVAGTAVLWAHVCSTFMYRTWYIVAAIAAAMVIAVAATGRLRLRGLLPVTLPVAGYFALLWIGSKWAKYPAETTRWALIDSIEIVVFALFVLAGLNSPGRAIALAVVSVVIPAGLMASFEYLLNPYASRLAGYSLVLLPLIVAFAFSGVHLSWRKWPWALGMGMAGVLLLVGRSRAPLAAALLVAAFSLMFFGKGALDRIRKGLAAILVMIIIALVLAAIPRTRPMVMTTFFRLTQLLPPGSVPFGGEAAITALENEIKGTHYVRQTMPRAEGGIRKEIRDFSHRLLRENFPAGIGYMNFVPHFYERTAMTVSLHNMYMTWLLEGGVVVALYVFVFGALLLFGIVRSLRRDETLEDRAYGIALLLSAGAVLFVGGFHQLHQSPALWAMAGLGAARCVAVRRTSPPSSG